ncbi:MAG: glycoside hydrolase family 2, partial [Prevotella sp.]|nr:glycoside hydrolase family 2 [Prevotella sp.]
KLEVDYTFYGVVDLLGICFDYREQQVRSKQWVGRGPYRVWQNRLQGPQYGYWKTDYNDPIPGESFEYPEFKGYFADVQWLQIETTEGKIGICQPSDYVGIYTPRDGRDHILYTLPETGIALLKAIPAVRNKVNTTDLNGPSAQPYWAKGNNSITATLMFE